MPAAHTGADRPGVDELVRNYRINRQELERIRESKRRFIAVFDDLLTAGTHFKAMQKAILAEAPFILDVAGFFIARRVFPPAVLIRPDDA